MLLNSGNPVSSEESLGGETRDTDWLLLLLYSASCTYCTAMQYSPPTPDFPLNLFSLSAIIAEEGEVHASIQIDEIFLMQPIREWFQTVCLILIFSISGPLKGKIWLLFQDHMSTTNVKIRGHLYVDNTLYMPIRTKTTVDYLRGYWDQFLCVRGCFLCWRRSLITRLGHLSHNVILGC